MKCLHSLLLAASRRNRHNSYLTTNLRNVIVFICHYQKSPIHSGKMSKETVWNPQYILMSKNNSGYNYLYAIVILNTKIKCTPNVLVPLWSKANYRFTVDGGTNEWFKWMAEHDLNVELLPSPNYVTGDMDSIDVKVLEILRDRRTSSVIVTDDQNETDFTKALKEIQILNSANAKQIESVIAVVDTSGRLDQIMANINTLFKSRTIFKNVDVYQLSSNSLSWLIPPGKHRIYIPEVLRENNEWCALIPIGEQCNHVTTTGLKWDLDNRTIKFGEIVSTSNTYDDFQPYVTIETDKILLWSMGLDGLFHDFGAQDSQCSY